MSRCATACSQNSTGLDTTIAWDIWLKQAGQMTPHWAFGAAASFMPCRKWAKAWMAMMLKVSPGLWGLAHKLDRPSSA